MVRLAKKKAGAICRAPFSGPRCSSADASERVSVGLEGESTEWSFHSDGPREAICDAQLNLDDDTSES
jgi:hypothetical protein